MPLYGIVLALVVGEDEHVQQRRGAHDEDQRDDAVAEEATVQEGWPPVTGAHARESN